MVLRKNRPGQRRIFGQNEASNAVAVRGLRHECIALVGGRLREAGWIDIAVDRFVDFRAGIERAQPGRQRRAGAFAGNVGLGDDEPVGEDRLLARFRRPAKRFRSGDGVHHRHNRFDVKNAAQRAVCGESLQDRARIGEPTGLDHDASEVGQLAALALDHHPAQRLLQVGAGDAAQAAVAEQHGLVGARPHERIVDAGRPELIDDDRGALPFRRCQKALEQRGLSGAEKAGDHGDRQPRSTLALEPAAELAGSG